MSIYHDEAPVTLRLGDALSELRDMPGGSVDCCVTSPPYFGLRDYGVAGQYGLEASPAEYVETMRALFAEVRRVLADDGTLWLNIGDSYCSKPGGPQGASGQRASRTFTAEGLGWRPGSGGGDGRGIDGRGQRNRDGVVGDLPAKNLLGIPWRTAFALQDDGWILRNEIIWAKPNAMPESAKDRFSNRHEHLFMFATSRRYWFDAEAFAEPGKVGNPGDVWVIPTQPFAAAHFATMPPALAERCVLAGCKPGGVVLDPFSGSGTTGLAATKHGRRYVGIDLSRDYLDLSLRTRFAQPGLDLTGGAA